MASHQEKVMAGLFLLLGLVLVSGVLFLIAGVNLTKATDPYYIYFEGTIGNLREGSDVKFQGVPVGQVEAMNLSHDLRFIEVELALNHGTRITQGTQALLRFSPLTSVYYIELMISEEGLGDDLEPGCVIPQEKTKVDAFVSQLPMMQESVLQVLSEVLDLLNPENRENFSTILERLKELVGDFNQGYESVRGEVLLVGKEFRQSLVVLDQTLADFTREVQAFNQNTGVTLGEGVAVVKNGVDRIADTVVDLELKQELTLTREALLKLIAQYEKTGGEMETLVSENRKTLSQLLKNLDRLTRQMQSFMDSIDKDPSRLIWSQERAERQTPE